MPSIETSIFQAIKERVDTLPMKAAYPIVWSTDESYQPDPSQSYLRVTWLPNINVRMFIGSTDPHQRPSILQIDVRGKKKFGEDVAIEVAGQVASHFPADLPLFFDGGKMTVQRAPDLGPTFVGTHIQVPVTIRLEAFV